MHSACSWIANGVVVLLTRSNGRCGLALTLGERIGVPDGVSNHKAVNGLGKAGGKWRIYFPTVCPSSLFDRNLFLIDSASALQDHHVP